MMKRRLSALVLTAALAGGVALTAVPAAHAAGDISAKKISTCNVKELRDQAQKAKNNGQHAKAKKLAARAAACEKADREHQKPFPK